MLSQFDYGCRNTCITQTSFIRHDDNSNRVWPVPPLRLLPWTLLNAGSGPPSVEQGVGGGEFHHSAAGTFSARPRQLPVVAADLDIDDIASSRP